MVNMKDPMPEPEPASAPKTPAVSAAVAILRHLAAQSAPVGVSAIARAVGLSPSSCFNIVRTLVSESFVDFDDRTKGYSLGLGSIALARKALDPTQAMEVARPALEDLASRFDVTSSLWRLSRNDRLVLIGFAESPATTRVHLTIGQRLPKYLGAMGRAVAAKSSASRAELAKSYGDLRWHRDPTLEVYLADVEAVRARGWAMDVDTFMQGVTTIAAPVVDGTGAVRFCVSSTIFSGQNDAALSTIGNATLDAADALARRLFGTEF